MQPDTLTRVCCWIAADNYLDLCNVALVSTTFRAMVGQQSVWYVAYKTLFHSTRLLYSQLPGRDWKKLFRESVRLRVQWHRRVQTGQSPHRSLFDIRHISNIVGDISVQYQFVIQHDKSTNRQIAAIHVSNASNESDDEDNEPVAFVILLDVETGTMMRFIDLPRLEQPMESLGVFDIHSKLVVGYLFTMDYEEQDYFKQKVCTALSLRHYDDLLGGPFNIITTLAELTAERERPVRGLKEVEALVQQDGFYLCGIDADTGRVAVLVFDFCTTGNCQPVLRDVRWIGGEHTYHISCSDDIPQMVCIIPTKHSNQVQVWDIYGNRPVAHLGGLEDFDSYGLQNMLHALRVDTTSHHMGFKETLMARPFRIITASLSSIVV
jgi:hypothetical protein